MEKAKKQKHVYKDSLFKNFFFSTVVVSLIFIMIELLLRTSGLVKVKSLKFPDQESDREIVGIFRPNQDFVQIDTLKSKLPYHIHINSQGLRGKEFSLKKSDNIFRVLCLGDSYTFSNYVNDDETFPYTLESFLNKKYNDKKFEVINGGASGYTILDELSYLKEKGIKVSPDLVILGFVMNDVSELTRKKGSRDSQKEAIKYWSISPIEPLRQKLVDTAIYNLFRTLKAYIKYKTKADDTIPEDPLFNIIKEKYDDRLLALWNKYEKCLIDMKDYLDKRKIKLVIVIFPIDYQVRMGWSDKPQSFLKEIGKKTEVEVCDLLPTFKKKSQEEIPLFFTPYDGHPTKHGYKLAALGTYEFLIAKELIPIIRNYNKKNIVYQ